MANVHGILWNWCLLKIQDPEMPFRNDLADTLGKLAYEPEHVVDILKVLAKEPDFNVRIALSWSSSQALTNMTRRQCRSMVETHKHLFKRLLQHPSFYLRIMACETICRLIYHNRVRTDTLSAFDESVEKMIHDFPNRSEVVEIVLRYLLARKPLYTLAQPHLLFPCKGQTCQTWKKAVVYISKLPCLSLESITLEDTAVRVPEDNVASVVESLDADTQIFLVHLIKELWVVEQECVLLRALRIVSHCKKVPRTCCIMVPLLLDTLEWLDCENRGLICYKLWELCFEMLCTISEKTKDMNRHFPRILRILSKSQSSTTRSRHVVKQLLGAMFEEEPQLLTVDMVAHNNFIMDLLPRSFVRSHVDELVQLLINKEPGPNSVHLVCQMKPDQQARHGNFLEAQRQYVVESIALNFSDIRRKFMANKWLPKLPLVLYKACLAHLEDAIITKDFTGMMPLFHVPSERLSYLKDVLFDQVLGQEDVFGHDRCRPSIALSLITLLPHSLLDPLVKRLVDPRLGRFDGNVLHVIIHPTNHLEERLFILKHLSPSLTKKYALEIARQHLHDKRHYIRNLVMEILIHTNETKTYTQWALSLLTAETTSVHAQHLAVSMLQCVPPHEVAALLDNDTLMGMGVRQACQILRHVTESSECQLFERAIMHFCEQFSYREECLNLLVTLPHDQVWNNRQKILDIVDQRPCVAWDASRHVLKILSKAGMVEAHDLLAKYKFQDVLF